MPIRRQLKNVVNNYSDAQVKVREATSNDPWGPSSSIMTEIADATYNVVAFSEIMTMIWKRLNDHGKNWRHVYKSLVLLEYIIKTGSERVAQQCRENIFAIQTLKDFQFIDRDGKDQGLNVREKAKQLVNLLKDEDRLKSERSRALKAKERFAQANSAIGSNTPMRRNSAGMRDSESASELRSNLGDSAMPTSRSWEPERKVYGAELTELSQTTSEIEKCRPSNQNEEELQLQLALALSKQEAEEQQKLNDKDEEKVQIAIQESQNVVGAMSAASSSAWDTQTVPSNPWGSQPVQSDPWSGNTVDSFGGLPIIAPQADPWSDPSGMGSVGSMGQSGFPGSLAPVQSSPWNDNPALSQPNVDPWGSTSVQSSAVSSLGGSTVMGQTPVFTNGSDVFGDPSLFSQSTTFSSTNTTTDLLVGDGLGQETDMFGLGSIGQALPPTSNQPNPDGFLGANSGLVNLDELVSSKPTSNNPFVVSPLTQSSQPVASNPFFQERPQAPTLNQLRSPPTGVSMAPNGGGANILLPAPLIPDPGSQTVSSSNNPFL